MPLSLLMTLLSAVRPPQPPSLPPAGAVALARPHDSLAGPRSMVAWTYTWAEGFIGSGGDVAPPVITTLKEALAHCDALARCRGITYAGTNATSGKLNVYFKMGSDVAHASGWSSWVKTAVVTPPVAKLTVGGSSNLELLLRQDYYTVQNLSRVGEAWSFTRPLDGTSVLPVSRRPRGRPGHPCGSSALPPATRPRRARCLRRSAPTSATSPFACGRAAVCRARLMTSARPSGPSSPQSISARQQNRCPSPAWLLGRTYSLHRT